MRKKYEIIDAADCGMDAIDDSCVDYFNAPLFYEMSVLYRTAIQMIQAQYPNVDITNEGEADFCD